MTLDTVLPALPSFDSELLLEELKNSRSPLPVVKPLLSRIQDESHTYFRQTLDAETLVRHRAVLIDQILACLWQHSGLNVDSLALIAVGGYGRGELHPRSDIDVLLLCQDDHAINANADALQSFITLLWDLKLDVGHSVRTLSESRDEAQKDLTIITNMMESRVVAGNAKLHQELKVLTSSDKMWSAKDFFHAKWTELKERHKKHKDSEYNLEPNVKNSPGSLRDIQTICWVTMRYFGRGTLQSLQDEGFLTHVEFERLDRSLRFLWQVRYALHMLAGREEDRLLFNLQREIAALLGFTDTRTLLGVEQFMCGYYRNQLATLELCDLLLSHFNEDFMKADRPPQLEVVNDQFMLANNFLTMREPDLFTREPHWLLEVFLLMAKTPQAKGIHSQTIRALRNNRHLIDDSFRKNPKHNAIFMELMRTPERVVGELSRMMRYGILGRYIPSFGEIIGMMEHDLFHIYTVDEHSFRMIRFLRHLRYGEERERFPLASEVIQRISKKEVLYLTALLHDTGKSIDGDHTENSGGIAEAFCRQHNLDEHDTHMVSWLCSKHLFMSQASQRIDLNNPEDIYEFAQAVKDLEHLDALYLISVGDMISTNPKIWTGWRAEQLNVLYHNTANMLKRGLDHPVSKADWIKEIQLEALQQLQNNGITHERVLEIWGTPGNDYFLREGVDNLVWHTLEIDAHGDSSKPLVSIRPTSNTAYEGATQIFIFMKDQVNLFAATTATLDQLNLNIQGARIMTSEVEHNAVDTYIVLDENNEPIEDKNRLQEIRDTLTHALADPSNYSTIIQRRTPRALKQFTVETRVKMSNDPILRSTVLEVIAADRPGLLARMGAIFAKFGAQMQSAKILTEGERVSDIFYIVDQHGLPFSDVRQCLDLKEAIIRGLEEQVEAQSCV